MAIGAHGRTALPVVRVCQRCGLPFLTTDLPVGKRVFCNERCASYVSGPVTHHSLPTPEQAAQVYFQHADWISHYYVV